MQSCASWKLCSKVLEHRLRLKEGELFTSMLNRPHRWAAATHCHTVSLDKQKKHTQSSTVKIPTLYTSQVSKDSKGNKTKKPFWLKDFLKAQSRLQCARRSDQQHIWTAGLHLCADAHFCTKAAFGIRVAFWAVYMWHIMPHNYNTLAQTCLIELWCGMNRTCKTHSII